MAALKSRQDTSGQLVLQSPLFPSLGSIASSLVWVLLLAFFFLPALGNGGQVDWESLAFLLFFFVVTAGTGILGSLISTSITLDQSSRTLTTTRRLLGIPLGSNTVSFNDLANVEYNFYRQRSGRYSHDAWRVDAVAKDGRRVPINWDGKKDEMASLAQTVANKTGAELVDNSVKSVSTVQQILDTIRPVPLPNPPAEQTESPTIADSTPAMPDASTPPVTSVPWSTPPADLPPATTPSWSDTMMRPTDLPAPSEPAPAPESPAAEPAAPAGPALRKLSIETLEKRVAEDTMDSDARVALAQKYQARNQPDRAIALYQQVLRLDPSNTGAQNNLGVALQQRGKRTEAEAAYRRAIALDPFSSTVHLNLGLLLRSMNRATDASQEFYQARQNARSDAETRAAEAASTGAKMDPQFIQA